jgi:hypothetical protein
MYLAVRAADGRLVQAGAVCYRRDVTVACRLYEAGFSTRSSGAGD